MLPLRIAFLWHQHQPYYKYENEFILPWVRFHGVKDYYDLTSLLNEFPKIKQNFNIVPSLLLQIEEYIDGITLDRIQVLSAKTPESLSISEKKEIINSFFTCNLENMIKPYPRYFELYEKAHKPDFDINSFSDKDFMDLQVWYNLTWIGENSRKNEFLPDLFQKNIDYTQLEKEQLLKNHIEILSKIKTELIKLSNSGQISVSFSPFYHPILPLLCDLNVGLENKSEVEFNYPEDADKQIKKGINYYQKKFGEYPTGSWSSEGSLSNEVLKLYIDNGIKWVASDEGILKKSRGNDFIDTEKFFPVKYNCEKGEITIFFRDHFLSDRIGFEYSSWNADDAVNDFAGHLHSIRNAILDKHGEDALKSSCVSIVLDGENCWEFYKTNGFDYLRTLYARLGNEVAFETVLLTEVSKENSNLFPKLNSIYAGSWINTSFDIWRGHKEDLEAWKMLKIVRDLVESKKNTFSEEKIEKVMELVYIAEGSDWFWWYGEDHFAPNDTDFDTLFRYYITKIYEEIGEKAPNNVYQAIMKRAKNNTAHNASSMINPTINGKIDGIEEWENAGYLRPDYRQSTMHRYGRLFEALHYGNNESDFFLRIDITGFLHDYILSNTAHLTIKLNQIHINFEFSYSKINLIEKNIENVDFAFESILEIKIARNNFNSGEIKIEIEVETASNKEFVPNDKELIYKFIG